jgi:hypothetical protein
MIWVMSSPVWCLPATTEHIKLDQQQVSAYSRRRIEGLTFHSGSSQSRIPSHLDKVQRYLMIVSLTTKARSSLQAIGLNLKVRQQS